MSNPGILKQLYYKSTGYSYTNLGRLFLRLFVGLMLMQFGVRQIIDYDSIAPMWSNYFASENRLWVSIIEIFCSFCIMIGFLTRIMILPPFVIMIVYAAKISIASNFMLDSVFYIESLSLPFMFLGIYFFLLIVGPGKISIDYYLSLYLINRHNDNEDDLEEV